MTVQQHFKWRVFISTGLVLTFLVMLISGIVLFVSPPGRVANWTDWSIFGLSKKGWQNQHVVFGFAFIILSIFHLFVINWKAFLSYIKAKASKGLNSPAELVTSLLLFAVLAAGTFWHLPPFEQIIALGDRLSASWENKAGGPPVPHAETLSLEELGKLPQVGASAETMIEKLRAAGVKVQSTSQTLQEIAEENGLEVQKLYEFIMEGRSPGGLQGSGWGRKTLTEAAETIGVSPLALQQALKQQGIKASPEEPIRDIATKNGMEPSELVSRINRMAEKR
jgi:predicted HTH domain antitoxin